MRQSVARFRLKMDRRQEFLLYDKYANFTMIHPYKFVDNLWLCRSIESIQGDIVECGTWRGGMSAALSETLQGRHSVLFDSFQGLPPAGNNDGDTAHQWIAQGKILEASQELAELAMNMSGSQRYTVFKGWFEETVPKYAAETEGIAILRLDGDWYDSTLCCLKFLFPKVADGGLIILDDYGHWEGCTRATHDYLSQNGRTEPVLHTRQGVAFIVKGTSYAADSWRVKRN